MNNSISVEKDDVRIELIGIKEGIIRCRYGLKDRIGTSCSMITVYGSCDDENITDPAGYVHTEDADTSAVLSCGSLKGSIDKDTLITTWMGTSDGSILLREGKKEFADTCVMKYTTGDEDPVIERVKTVDGERNFIKNLIEIRDHDAWQGRLFFEFSKDEHIYGLGQAEEGVYDHRHHVKYLYQHNMRIPMPMFISTKGYGILFDCTSLMTFSDTEDGSYMFFDTIPCLDYYFVSGRCLDDIISGFRYLTGEAVMLPKWSFGYIQSKEQYYTADELVNVAERYRQLDIPIDCIVQDWNTWEKDKWGNKILDEDRYGNMKECSLRLHEMNVHTMISVWPNMNSGTDNYEEFLSKGQLLNDLATYDAFDEDARDTYWKQAKEGLFDKGFDSFWCDSTEPFSGPDWNGPIKREPWKRFMLVGDEHKKYLPPEKANAFSLAHAQGMYENFRKTDGHRLLNLSRSGYAGSQRYGVMLWSGDTTASFDTLKKQITEGLNMGLSGYPYWTLDIGGFFTVGEKWQNRGCGCNNDPSPKWFWKGEYDEGVKDPAYCELYVRWLQLGVFLPMFRSHGTDTPREIWNFGKSGDMFYDAIERSIRLRYLLMPYIYSLAGAVTERSDTMMRSLLFDFPDDERSPFISDEFMFGRNLLVCPVTSPMYYDTGGRTLKRDKTWKCYLPEGCVWYDIWDNKKYIGGTTVTAASPIDRIPVFAKGGSIIPLRRGLSYAAQDDDSPLELHIFTGCDGEFIYYDDAGDDYSYENGSFEKICLTWHEAQSLLAIGNRQGDFPGMRKSRLIKIYVNGNPVCETEYTGRLTEIRL